MSQTIVSDRSAAIQEAQRLIASDVLILDTETTGLETTDSVVEIAIVDVQGRTIFQSLVYPESKMSQGAQAIHGISPAELERAPRFAEVWPQVQALLTAGPFAVYNSDFDLRLIRQTARRARVTLPETWADDLACCLMTLYAAFRGEVGRYGDYRWVSLSRACQEMHVAPGNHRAVDDAVAALGVLKAMANSEPEDEPPF